MNIKLEETCHLCGVSTSTFDEAIGNEKQLALRCAYCGHFHKWANKAEKDYYNVHKLQEKAKNNNQYFDSDSIKFPLNSEYGQFVHPTKLIKIKYHVPIEKIVVNKKGDWIDLRAAHNYRLKKGESCIISLGISVQLPYGYEAHVVPRSSTFKKWHIIQTNHIGIIDNSYSGDNDIWGMPVLATEDTVIHFNDRICQFRIAKRQPDILFEEVEHLGNTDRGGFGSTGTN